MGNNELVEVNAAVGEFAECSLLLELCGSGRSVSLVLLRQRFDDIWGGPSRLIR